MNKFKRYKCDTCNKEVDVDNDLTHAFIDRCNLTAGCLGTLRLIGEKNYKDNILNFDTPIQTSKIGGESVDKSVPARVDIASSGVNDITIAVRRGIVPISSYSELEISLGEIMNKEQEYREYVFNLSVPVSAISGKDHSIEQKVLAFESTDSVVMFINGQEVDSTLFTAESNLIRFNQQITYNTYASSTIFVKVLVFTAEETISKTLTFKKNVQGLSTSAWSNVDKVTFLGQEFELFTCQSLAGLDLNSRLTVDGAKIGSTNIPLDEMHFLLAQEPFHVVDRITSRSIRADHLDSSVQHLKYQLVSKVPRLLVTSMAIGDIFPAVAPLVVFNQKTENAITTSVADDTSLNLNITSNNKYILGPV